MDQRISIPGSSTLSGIYSLSRAVGHFYSQAALRMRQRGEGLEGAAGFKMLDLNLGNRMSAPSSGLLVGQWIDKERGSISTCNLCAL